MKLTKPNMSPWFRARIDWHTRGMLSTMRAERPSGVARIVGDVGSRDITVIMSDGTEHYYVGGVYSQRKVHGCYPPLMPKYAGNSVVGKLPNVQALWR